MKAFQHYLKRFTIPHFSVGIWQTKESRPLQAISTQALKLNDSALNDRWVGGCLFYRLPKRSQQKNHHDGLEFLSFKFATARSV